MSDHTPGPWGVEFDEVTYEWVVTWKGGYARVNGWFCEDNARLVAAAPQMLEILEAISNWDQHLKEDEDGEVDFEDGYHQVLGAARAGIAIAEGVYDE